MTVLPPGLIALPDVPPITEQHQPQWVRPPVRRRSAVRRAAFVGLVALTVAVGASAARDRSGTDAVPAVGPVAVGTEAAGAAATAGG